MIGWIEQGAVAEEVLDSLTVDLVNLKKSYLEGSFAVRAVKPFYPNNQ
jgi:hypothetical protein